jgi:hypothetical protein
MTKKTNFLELAGFEGYFQQTRWIFIICYYRDAGFLAQRWVITCMSIYIAGVLYTISWTLFCVISLACPSSQTHAHIVRISKPGKHYLKCFYIIMMGRCFWPGNSYFLTPFLCLFLTSLRVRDQCYLVWWLILFLLYCHSMMYLFNTACCPSVTYCFNNFCLSVCPSVGPSVDVTLSSTQLLLYFFTDLDDTCHKVRWWCLDVHEGRIFRFVDFGKSYGPWHLDFFYNIFLVNATPPTFFDGFGWNFAQSKMMMPRCAWSEDFLVRQVLQELWNT